MPPALEEQSLNHWTAREVPTKFFFFFKVSNLVITSLPFKNIYILKQCSVLQSVACIYNEYYSALKTKDILTQATTDRP